MWKHAEPRATLHYTFNPALTYRVLAFSGDGAEEQRTTVASFVPHLDRDWLVELLGADETEPVLLGLFAAKELVEVSVYAEIRALQDSEDELVAAAAAHVAATLPVLGVRHAVQRFVDAISREPGRSPVFAAAGPPRVRRQIIRQIGRDLDEEADLDRFLRTALSDDDLEVRLSGLVWTVRRGRSSLRKAVKSARLPSDGFYADLRRLALRQLNHKPPPDDAAHRQLLHALLGEPGGVFDETWVLLQALADPLVHGRGPQDPPDATELDGAVYRLRRSGESLVWIPDQAAWLGGSPGGPLRRIVPSSGFFVARRPMTIGLARWIEAGGTGPVGVASDDDPAFLETSIGQARDLVQQLAQIEGAPIALPTADQWELAVRGPDGRAYPWGNFPSEDPGSERSAWDLENPVADVPTWTTDGIGCGGPDARCAARDPAPSVGRVRFIVRAG